MSILLIIDDSPHYVSTLEVVPEKGSVVKFNAKKYKVSQIVHDLDEGSIEVYLV